MQKVDNFLDSLKSKHTKYQYKYHLDRYFKWKGKSDLAGAESIPAYLMSMKHEGLSYSYRNGALFALKHFYTMSDVVLNWPKISKFLGENIVSNEIRGYTHEEIQKLITVADTTYKAIILTLASTGMRREALVQINPLTDMEYLEDYKLYKIRIYRRTRSEQVCFSTPEAAEAIKLHMNARDKRYFHNVHPKAVTERLRNLAIKAGIVQAHPDTETSTHGQYKSLIPAVHGLRKFAITEMARAKVDTEVAKILTGHSIGVRGRYLNYSEDDLLVEYVKAIPFLTISQENRLKKQVEQMTKDQNEVKALRAEFNDLMEQLRKKVAS
jgi:integrase